MNGVEPYLSAARTLLAESGCVVTKWRQKMTGGAYTHSPEWRIEVPEPRGPISYAVFAHEVGHQMLHRKDTRERKVPRWQEELEAWMWALATFERFRLPKVELAKRDCEDSMAYAFSKALRRSRTLAGREALAARFVEASPGWLLDALCPPGDERSEVYCWSWDFECHIGLARERSERGLPACGRN